MSSTICTVLKPTSDSKSDSCPPPLPAMESGQSVEENAVEENTVEENTMPQYPPSLGTDSTLSTSTAVNQDLWNKVESMAWVLDHEPAPVQGLTYFALQAHEYSTKNSGYHRDLAGWCRDGDMFDQSCEQMELTDSMLVTKQSKSRVTECTTSSYDMLSDYESITDMDHDVSGAGAVFHDIASPQVEDDLIFPKSEK